MLTRAISTSKSLLADLRSERVRLEARESDSKLELGWCHAVTASAGDSPGEKYHEALALAARLIMFAEMLEKEGISR